MPQQSAVAGEDVSRADGQAATQVAAYSLKALCAGAGCRRYQHFCQGGCRRAGSYAGESDGRPAEQHAGGRGAPRSRLQGKQVHI